MTGVQYPLSIQRRPEATLGHSWGKVMLFGEYAVLESYPALLIGTPQKATASYQGLSHLKERLILDSSLREILELSEREDTVARYIIEGHQWGWSVLGQRGQADYESFGAHFMFIEDALLSLEAPQGIYTVDTQKFGLYRQGVWTKMGIGSSGASTAAVVDLITQLRHNSMVEDQYVSNDQYQRFLLTRDIHRRVQGGLGSGADVAASIYGGLIEFELMANTQHSSPSINALDIRLPYTSGVWRGGSQSTISSLQKVRAWKASSPNRYQKLIANLGETSQEVINALKISVSQSSTIHPLEWMKFIERGAEAIRSFGTAVGLQTWTSMHDRWAHIVSPLGGVIKPTGAGGNDLTLLACESAEAEERCLVALAENASIDGVELQTFSLGR